MYLAGFVSLLLALLLSVWGGGLALLRLNAGISENVKLIRNLSWGVCGAFLLASAILLHALFWQDYSVEYVASYTDAFLPLFYRLTAFWAGQQGSLLFWATCMAICGWLWSCSGFSKSVPAATQLWFWCFFYFLTAFFALLLVCYCNPFILLSPAPADGNGLNPLLQNPGMVIHPPLLFMGYALFAVPACLCVAQRLAPAQASPSWFTCSRPFLLGGWLLLTAGIVIGAWWAYMELGWGGYWGWDPVENASLLPWLAATALLHILAIEAGSGKFARFSSFLMLLTLSMTFLATWLTRSGVIESVHAFGEGGVGIPLLIFTLFLFFIGLLAIFSSKTTPASLAQPASREGAIILTTWIFLALAFIILLATLWPLFSKAGQGLAQGLDASFYNRVCLPIATMLICLLAICRVYDWQGSLGKTGKLKFTIICLAFICACALQRVLGYGLILPMIAAAGGFAALIAALLELFQHGWWRNPARAAAFGAHAGIALITIGVAFSGPYTQDYELFLKEGETAKAGQYAVTLEKAGDGAGKGYDYLRATLKISQDGASLGELSPERRIYAKYGSMQFSEVDVISGLARDVYASLLGMDEEGRILVKISIEPLVNWIWIGGFLMCLLPLFGLWRKKTGAARGAPPKSPALENPVQNGISQ